MEKYVYISSLEVARKLTEQLLKWMDEDPQKPFYIAISGGTSPIILFHVWCELYLKIIDWSRIHIYWVDERCVDPRSAESNFGMTRKMLLEQAPIPEEQIHRIIGEIDADFECKRYTKIVNDTVPQKDGVPIFDLIVLGLGDDGHTASIFPGQESLLTSPEIYVASKKPDSKQERVTMTGKIICSATRTVFFVTGETKASIMQHLLEETERGKSFPAYYIAKNAKKVMFYVDQKAGRYLTFG